MRRTKLDSSVLASVGWSHGTLELEFTSGRVYRYLTVPEAVYEELVASESPGAYFNEYVKETYEYVPYPDFSP